MKDTIMSINCLSMRSCNTQRLSVNSSVDACKEAITALLLSKTLKVRVSLSSITELKLFSSPTSIWASFHKSEVGDWFRLPVRSQNLTINKWRNQDLFIKCKNCFNFTG